MACFISYTRGESAGDMWHLLYDAYSGMHSQIMHKGHLSHEFYVHQSVSQGGVLSPWLCLLYLNDMLGELRSLPGALRIGDTIVSFIAQADDVALLALSPKELQIMINIVYIYTALNGVFSIMSPKPQLWFLGRVSLLLTNENLLASGTLELCQFHSYIHINI